MSGKGSKRRTEDIAAVEANWPTNWNARDGVSAVSEDEGADRKGDAEEEE